MQVGITLLVVAVLIAAIWILIEFKRLKHKIFAIALIGLILFTYLSFTLVIKDKGVDLKTPGGWLDASKLYFSWLGSLFGNFKSITTHAISLDWTGENKTSEG